MDNNYKIKSIIRDLSDLIEENESEILPEKPIFKSDGNLSNRNFKIFKLNTLIQESLDLAINESGEIVNDEALAIFQTSIESKNEFFLDVACEIRNLESESEAIESVEKGLKERRLICKNKIESMKKFLQDNIGKGEKLADGRVKISWRKSSSVVFDSSAPPPENADEKFTKTTIEFSKTKIKTILDSGEGIPWAYISENQNIQIK